MKKTQLHYRIDGGDQSYYTNNKKEVDEIFNSVLEDFGVPVVVWEIKEEWSEKDGWEMVDENIIKEQTGLDEFNANAIDNEAKLYDV